MEHFVTFCGTGIQDHCTDLFKLKSHTKMKDERGLATRSRPCAKYEVTANRQLSLDRKQPSGLVRPPRPPPGCEVDFKHYAGATNDIFAQAYIVKGAVIDGLLLLASCLQFTVRHVLIWLRRNITTDSTYFLKCQTIPFKWMHVRLSFYPVIFADFFGAEHVHSQSDRCLST